jgi:hypothetical protein
MQYVLHLISAFLLVISASAWAGEKVPVSEKLYLAAYRSEMLNAVVDAIDHQTREVTLTDSEGNAIMFMADPDVRNLDQVEVGDHVTADYHEEITVSVRDTKGAEPGSSYVEEVSGAPKGAKPDGTIVTKTVVNAIVEAINLQNNTFKLRFPDDNVQEFTAENPENLMQASVGDLVVITLNQSLDILVKQPDGN